MAPNCTLLNYLATDKAPPPTNTHTHTHTHTHRHTYTLIYHMLFIYAAGKGSERSRGCRKNNVTYAPLL